MAGASRVPVRAHRAVLDAASPVLGALTERARTAGPSRDDGGRGSADDARDLDPDAPLSSQIASLKTASVPRSAAARVEVEVGDEDQDTVHRFLHYVYAGEVLYACSGGDPDEKALDGGPFPNADDPVAVASLAALLGCASRLGVAHRVAMCSVETSASARGSRI